jgi:hypothetical protein
MIPWFDINVVLMPSYITKTLVFYIIFLWLNNSQDEPLDKMLKLNSTNCCTQTMIES